MFKVIFTLLVAVSLIASEGDNEQMSPMELLLFKIGFTALVDEFETEKNNTQSNTARIETLEKNFELLVKFMEMTKREMIAESDTPSLKSGENYGIYNISEMKKELSAVLEAYKKEMSHSKDREISQLKNEIAELKRDIRLIAAGNNPDRTAAPLTEETKEEFAADKAEALRQFRVVVDEMHVKSRPTPASRDIALLRRGERVGFRSCDDYGWCALKNREGYVPRHLFLPAE